MPDLACAEWRLMFSPPADGATNMAVDEAILLAVAEGASPPTLRFFAWEPPCMSLGYAQPWGDVDHTRVRALGWDLVRRPTGGRAILHTDELTYSVAASADEPRMRGGVLGSYRRLSAGLMAGLARLGLRAESHAGPRRPAGSGPAGAAAVCFEAPSRYEITSGGQKLLGSAQMRRRGAALQHGSLPLAGDIARICDGLAFDSEAERDAARARVRARATTVEAALPAPRAVAWAEAAQALAGGLAETLNLRLVEGELSSEELVRAAALRREKYATDEWTLRL